MEQACLPVLEITFRASCGQPLARAKYRRRQEIFGWRKENYKKGASLLASIGNHFSRELQSGLDVTFRASCGLPLARANSRRRQGGQREIPCCRLAVVAISSASLLVCELLLFRMKARNTIVKFSCKISTQILYEMLPKPKTSGNSGESASGLKLVPRY